jgi:hypothetical protein
MGPLSLEYAYGFDRIGGGKWRPHFQFGMFY